MLDHAALAISPVLRRELAGKPSPWLVKAHDVGVPTNVHRDIPWHLLDKERDPRFYLPHRGKLGLFNPNADVHWLIGFGTDGNPVSFDPPRRYVDHLANLAAQRIEVGPLTAHVLFLPVTSDTVVAVIDLHNGDAREHEIGLESRATKPAGPNEPAVHEPAAAWNRPTHRYGYGITVTSGKLQNTDLADPRTVMMQFEELAQDKTPAGSLLCTLTGDDAPDATRIEPESSEGPFASLFYGRLLRPSEHVRLTLALNLHRHGPQQIETRNQIVLYPAETAEQARAYALGAARDALACDWLSLVAASFRVYERTPVVSLPARSWNASFYCALELPRGNTWSPQGVLAQPWYTFCRVHGHEPYGWWSYGMHAHEHLCTLVANLTEPALSQSFLRGHFRVQQADGCIQYGINHSGRNFHEPLATAPLLAGEAWQAYLWSGDRQFLAEAYTACGRFVNWWRSPARTRAAGPSTGSAPSDRMIPALQHWRDYVESLRDDKDLATWTATDGAENQAALDLNCYLLHEERTLVDMARELGRSGEAEAWQANADSRTALMREHLWHAKDGVYYGRDLATGRWARVMDVSTFFPLWCGLATDEQAASIVRLLKDPQAFATRYPVATLAVRHMPEKMRGVYHWRGANWVEMSWLAIQGLSRCGHRDEAARVAEANCRMVFDTLEKTGHFREFYNTLTGEPSDLTDYIWTAMPAIMIVETFFGIRPGPQGLEIGPVLPVGWNDIRVGNLHVRGRVISVQVGRNAAGRPAVTLNGRLLPDAPNGVWMIPWSELPTR